MSGWGITPTLPPPEFMNVVTACLWACTKSLFEVHKADVINSEQTTPTAGTLLGVSGGGGCDVCGAVGGAQYTLDTGLANMRKSVQYCKQISTSYTDQLPVLVRSSPAARW
jgi:hypothetical protein